MAIDPSIAAGQAPGSLLQTLSGATQLRGHIQQQQANVAASEAYKQSTGPDGQIDYGKLTALLSQGPAAYNLPEYQARINEARNSTLQYDKGQLELAQKRNGMLSGAFGSLLGKPIITAADVMGVAAKAQSLGLADDKTIMAFTGDMPMNDPAALREWVRQHTIGFDENLERMKVLQPQNETLNTGGVNQFISRDPNTGQVTVMGGVQNTLTPGQATENVQVYDPATQTMRTITKEQQLQMQGGGQGGLPAPAGGGSLGTGRINTAPGAVGLQAAPAIGSAEAAGVVAKGAAEASQVLQRSADAAPQAIYQFQNMRAALPDIDTGPGTDWRNQAAAFATGLAPDIAAKLVDPQKVASYEEFKKYATQAAQATLAGLGEGTDSKLASAYAANPGTNLSKLGNQHLLDVLIAGQRATLAKNQAWQNSGLPPEQYNKFSTQWNKEIDPRVFAAQDMDVAARYKMLDSLPKKDQETFKRSYINARNLGYVQ